MKRKRIILAIILAILLACSLVSVMIFSSYRSVIFRDFEDAQAVEDYVLSTVTLQKTTLTEVRDLVEGSAYGTVDCYFSSIDEIIFVCKAPTGDLRWYYSIRFVFENDVLIDVSVGDQYIGL